MVGYIYYSKVEAPKINKHDVDQKCMFRNNYEKTRLNSSLRLHRQRDCCN